MAETIQNMRTRVLPYLDRRRPREIAQLRRGVLTRARSSLGEILSEFAGQSANATAKALNERRLPARCAIARRQVVGALDHQRSRPAEGLIAMTHPRHQGSLRQEHRARTTPSSRSVAPHQLAVAATRPRQPLNGRSTSIVIAALDDLPVVSDADDPAAAKRARWAQNSARRS